MDTNLVAAFAAGLFIGVFLGIFIACMCVSAHDADERAERIAASMNNMEE